jgi:hypothetical protein
MSDMKFTTAGDMMENGFRKMQRRLEQEGWYVGWNEPCCQSCAWACLPDYLGAVYNDEGYLVHPETKEELDYLTRDKVYREVDLSKVLFNHSQDCEYYIEGEECPDCEGEGYDENDEECMTCFGKGEIEEGFDPSDYDTSVDGFICNSPEQQKDSYFCFDGSEQGVANFKEIMPILEECGVYIDSFDETGKTRISLSWD